ncbi:hypothetical protein ACFC1T_09390 [Kitasatospora sp. NPDC056076]|uniref:hypothetical protein n=1 Tax=Kitasatospora sp. NPDC056076 TaxID=3345703 RepID=UPI0035DEB7FE
MSEDLREAGRALGRAIPPQAGPGYRPALLLLDRHGRWLTDTALVLSLLPHTVYVPETGQRAISFHRILSAAGHPAAPAIFPAASTSDITLLRAAAIIGTDWLNLGDLYDEDAQIVLAALTTYATAARSPHNPAPHRAARGLVQQPPRIPPLRPFPGEGSQ